VRLARASPGAFGALLIPQGFGLLGSVFPREHIGKGFSAFGSILGLSAAGGRKIRVRDRAKGR
jgi:hypothetical protein